jgi:hypothetical protein
MRLRLRVDCENKSEPYANPRHSPSMEPCQKSTGLPLKLQLLGPCAAPIVESCIRTFQPPTRSGNAYLSKNTYREGCSSADFHQFRTRWRPDVNPHVRRYDEGGGVASRDQPNQWASDIPRTNMPEQTSGVVVISAAA